MRIDGLLDSIDALRSLLSDRLEDYAELVNSTSRANAEAVEEYRHVSERSVAELRRSTRRATRYCGVSPLGSTRSWPTLPP